MRYKYKHKYKHGERVLKVFLRTSLSELIQELGGKVPKLTFAAGAGRCGTDSLSLLFHLQSIFMILWRVWYWGRVLYEEREYDYTVASNHEAGSVLFSHFGRLDDPDSSEEADAVFDERLEEYFEYIAWRIRGQSRFWRRKPYRIAKRFSRPYGTPDHICEVALYNIGYFEALSCVYPVEKLFGVCIQRDSLKDNFISWMKRTISVPQWVLDYSPPRFYQIQKFVGHSWNWCFPKFPGTHEESCWSFLYWHAEEAQRLQHEYPETFRVIMTSQLNSDEGVREILIASGFDEEVINIIPGIRINTNNWLINYLSKW